MRYLLLVVGFFECVTIGGLSGGWPPLEVILIGEKQYFQLCQNSTGLSSCPAQTGRLNSIFSTSTALSMGSSYPFGLFFDKFGPRSTLFLSSLLFVAGSVVFAVSSSVGFNGFTVGYSLANVASVGIVLCFSSIAVLFPKHMGFVVTLIQSGATASTPLIFLGFEFLYFKYGLTHQYIFAILAAIGVPSLGVSFLFTSRPFVPYDEDMFNILFPEEAIVDASSDPSLKAYGSINKVASSAINSSPEALESGCVTAVVTKNSTCSLIPVMERHHLTAPSSLFAAC